jgi:hypothetical protein
MQARGQATFERILDATARLLDEVGTEALTTNLIARTADVNVATLYPVLPEQAGRGCSRCSSATTRRAPTSASVRSRAWPGRRTGDA